jgi:nucleoid-associated protein YejK
MVEIENLEVKEFIIHRIQKERGTDPSILTLRAGSLPLDDKVKDFLFNVNKTYEKKTAREYGAFNPNSDIYKFPSLLRDYLFKDLDFVELSHRSMKIYKTNLDKENFATGGYIIFSHYLNNGVQKFLVIGLNDKVGYAIDSDSLTLKGSIHLDLDKIDLANKIDVDLWATDEENYLSFIKGKKNVSKYFLEFIGCTNNISPKKISDNLVNALQDFMKNNNFDFERGLQTRARVLDYCNSQATEGKEVEMRTIANLVLPEDPDSFYLFATSEERRIGDTFHVDKDVIKRLTMIAYKNRSFKIAFENDALHDTIRYDESTNILEIHNVPRELKELILDRY